MKKVIYTVITYVLLILLTQQVNGQSNYDLTNRIDMPFTISTEPLADVLIETKTPGGNISKYLGQAAGNGLYTTTISLGKKSDERENCIKTTPNLRYGVCEDGKYILDVHSYDAAGNKKSLEEVVIERDTVAPAKPIVEDIHICGSNICAYIKGESNTKLFINGNFTTTIESNYSKAVIDLSYKHDTLYSYAVQQKDTAGNISEASVYTYKTPALAIGDSAPYGELTDKVFTQPQLNVKIDGYTGDYQIDNLLIPAPILTFTSTNKDNIVSVYGVALGKNSRLQFNAEIRYKSYLQALSLCGLTNKTCLEEATGQANITKYLADIDQACNGSTKCKFAKYGESKVNFKQHFTQIDHAQIVLEKPHAQIQTLWNDGIDGRFKFTTQLSNMLKIGDAVTARLVIFGNAQIDGIDINYRGTTRQSAEQNKGISSPTSNSIVITKPKNEYPRPVGFPFREFKFNSTYTKYFGQAGSYEICAVIQCNGSSTRGTIKITRGANEAGHGPTSIDFAPFEYSAKTPTIVVSTVDGQYIYDKDGFDHGVPKLIDGRWKCELKREYNSIQAVVVTPDGKQVKLFHLSERSYELQLWKGKRDAEVKRGDVLGFVGNTGCSSGPHLHYEISGMSTADYYKTFSAADGLNELPQEINVRNEDKVINYEKNYYNNKNENTKVEF